MAGTTAGEEPVSTSARYLASGPGAGDVWAAEAAADGRHGTQKIVRAGTALRDRDRARHRVTVSGPEGEAPGAVRVRLLA